ncbi:uncharacterized protein MELLADRAFT_101493 [Melampsora larici-populina 98AG31]|uniref:Uncharacterized protein n=1 Tax=Melampsora larici-populina (strain 98AG31 / pathotype 3-4-7) TaxID=747676 RepID=F4R4Y0_MELLP|nr:uncharacterized protein MELLADRAFT_101493 [Melampsora larici-populina 98AG31]EGG12916.1 hypothetical protein MELLADRAFT_101493 [Melampsora larici-populina 98AG31]
MYVGFQLTSDTIIYDTMPTNPNNRSLKKIKSNPKPVTPRQVEFLAQKEKNKRQAERYQKPIIKVAEAAPFPRHRIKGVELDLGLPNPDINHLDNENYQHDLLDPNGFIPFSPGSSDDDTDSCDSLDSDDQDVISGIRRARYDAKRLQREMNWVKQCQQMLSSFLRCRQITSNWGNSDCWNNDFKEPCSCPRNRTRVARVDIVDLLGYIKRGTEVRKRLKEAESELASLLKQDPTMTTEYLEEQWNRQREMQKKLISESAKDKRDQILVYLGIEEELVEARDQNVSNKLKDIQSKSRRARTGEERNELLRLPNTVVLLETRALAFAEELGVELLRQDASDDEKKALITIQLAKAKL